MDLHYLKKIIRLIEQSAVDEIEIEEEGIKIRVAKNISGGGAGNVVPIITAASGASGSASSGSAPAKADAAAPAANLHEVKSPIVGTFYRAPAPDADPYVQIGQIVEKGTVLCLIEAMKLMNEIESDVAGRVVKCLVENAKPVEYNQPMFIIEPV